MSDLKDRLVLSTSDLEVGYKGNSLLVGLDLTIRAGDITLLIGDNGTGKSSLLRTLSGLQRKLSGSIIIDEQELSELSARDRSRQFATVFSGRPENIRMTGLEYVGQGRYPFTGWNGQLRQQDIEMIHHCIEQTNAKHLMDKSINSISDGELQRLTLARALAQEPNILLLDEPTSFLDRKSKLLLADLIRELAEKQNLSAIIATHDIEYFSSIASQTWEIPTGTTVGLNIDRGDAC